MRKSSRLYFFGLIAVFVLAGTPLFARPTILEERAALRELLGIVNTDSITATIQNLQDFGTRYEYSKGRGEAAEYLIRRFKAYCPDVVVDPFSFSDSGDEYRSENIVATFRGSAFPDSVIVIGAHYDSYSEKDPEQWAPGADDNASGVAGLMEMARLLKGTSPRYTLECVAFSAEEIDLCGSRHFAEQAATEKRKIKAMINLDMIGRPSSGNWTVTITGNRPSQWLVNLASSMAKSATSLRTEIWIEKSEDSDDGSFQQQGFSAILMIEKNSENNPFYHTGEDVLSNMNPAFAAEIVKAAMATVTALCGTSTGAEENPVARLPAGPVLFGNFPNPFNPITTIRYSLSSPSRVCLTVRNPLGREIATLVDDIQAAGEYSAIWNGRNRDGRSAGSGVYIVHLQAEDRVLTRKMVLVK